MRMQAGISEAPPFSSRGPHLLRARDKTLEVGKRTLLMGVVNITPDSFSDGGRYLEPGRAIAHALELARQGADLLDLGGESSRPGAEPVEASLELERLLPVLERLRGETRLPISVDTRKPAVAQAVLEAGADIINDITALGAGEEMARPVARYQAGLVLMHMRGTPRTMQTLSPSPDILAEIHSDLGRAIEMALGWGIQRDHLILDPGIGFGKNLVENCRILNRLSFLEDFRLPLLVGTSRKSFLGTILGRDVHQRGWGTAASVALAVARGAHLVRVHDAAEMKQVVEVTDAILQECRSR